VTDGRWHSAGQRIVYCTSSEALAALEVRVHVGRFIPRAPFAMHVIDVPDRLVRTVTRKELPKDWSAVPADRGGQRFGDAWLARRETLAMQVPSVHSRSDFNLLLNPSHPDIGEVHVVEGYSYRFDPRLF